jgi:hypothetical protein
MASPNITPAQQKALATALTEGRVWYHSNYGDRSLRVHGVRRGVRQGLVAMGLLKDVERWRRGDGAVWPHLILTDEGRAVALTLTDRESSASRQHYIETGRYLKYGDRPEFGGTI